MIKEILLFMLLLFHFSNGETSEFETCQYDLDSEMMGGGKVCIPSRVKGGMQFNPHIPWERPDKKTDLDVDISNLQIIEIESHTITLRAQSFTSLMADLRQDIDRVSSFSRCCNGTFS